MNYVNKRAYLKIKLQISGTRKLKILTENL